MWASIAGVVSILIATRLLISTIWSGRAKKPFLKSFVCLLLTAATTTMLFLAKEQPAAFLWLTSVLLWFSEIVAAGIHDERKYLRKQQN